VKYFFTANPFFLFSEKIELMKLLKTAVLAVIMTSGAVVSFAQSAE
jgi:hypothetical protein